MHTALYIEDVNEVHAADKAKSLRQEHSLVFIEYILKTIAYRLYGIGYTV